MATKRALTVKEEIFCIAVASGMRVGEAYISTYNTKKKNGTSHGDAYDVYKKPLVKERIREIIMDKYSPLILSQADRIRLLSNTALTGDTKDALKAIDILNKMDGSYVEKIDVNYTGQVHVYLPEKRVPLVST